MIIGMTMAIAIPALTGTSTREKRQAMRQIGKLSQYLHNEASYKALPLRLVIDMNVQKFWAETAPSETDGEDFQRSKFTDRFVKEEYKLPDGLKVVEVDTPRSGKISEGAVFALYTPFAYSDPLAIHFRDDDKTEWTVMLEPLTGRGRIYDGYFELVINQEQ